MLLLLLVLWVRLLLRVLAACVSVAVLAGGVLTGWLLAPRISVPAATTATWWMSSTFMHTGDPMRTAATTTMAMAAARVPADIRGRELRRLRALRPRPLRIPTPPARASVRVVRVVVRVSVVRVVVVRVARRRVVAGAIVAVVATPVPVP